MEPITTNLVTALAVKGGEAATEIAKKEAEGFLAKLFGPSAQAIGDSLSIRYRERMFNNLVDVVARAKKKLKDAGVEPCAVPLRVIHPLLESAALEDTPDVQEMWGNLLAGAATHPSPFYPTFIDIVRHLSVEDAKFLRLLVERLDARIDEWEKQDPDREKRGTHPAHHLGTYEQIEAMYEEANGPLHTTPSKIYIRGAMDNICRLGILNRPSLGKPQYSLEGLGLIFIDLVVLGTNAL